MLSVTFKMKPESFICNCGSYLVIHHSDLQPWPKMIVSERKIAKSSLIEVSVHSCQSGIETRVSVISRPLEDLNVLFKMSECRGVAVC